MAGDPTLASIWPDADVYIAPLGTVNPATVGDPFPGGWELVGLLDGDEGFTESRDVDKDDIYAWGGIIVRTSRKNFKLTKKFTALEDNDTVRSVVWPGSTSTTIVVPRPDRIKVAFETREDAKVKRLISRHEAEIDVDGDVKDSEGDLTKYELVATIFPDGNGVLFDRQETP